MIANNFCSGHYFKWIHILDSLVFTTTQWLKQCDYSHVRVRKLSSGVSGTAPESQSKSGWRQNLSPHSLTPGQMLLTTMQNCASEKNNLAEMFKVNGMEDGQVKPFSLEVMAKERRNECLHYDDGGEKWKRWDEFVVHPEFLKIAKSLHVRRREDLKTKDYTILSPCTGRQSHSKK